MSRAMTKRPSPHIIERFAQAVSGGVQTVPVLDDNNEVSHWLPLSDAAREDLPFFVSTASHTFAVDADNLDAPAAIEALSRRLGADGFNYIVVASGGGDEANESHRRHLFAVIDDPRWRADYEEWVRQNYPSLDVRRDIRPPLVRHRTKRGRSRLLEPRNSREALRRLEQSVGNERSDRPLLGARNRGGQRQQLIDPDERPLDGDRSSLDHEAQEKLTNGLGPEDSDRSALIMSLVWRMLLANWTLREAYEAFIDPSNAAGERVREEDEKPRGGLRYLELSWVKVLDTYNEHGSEVLDELDDLAVAVERYPFEDRVGETLRAILRAHISCARDAVSLVYGASERQLAERSAFTRKTVRKRNKELLQKGLIRQISSGNATKAAYYSLKRSVLNTTPLPGSHPLDAGSMDFEEVMELTQHDAFRYTGGHNKNGLRVLVLLLSGCPLSVPEIVAQVPFTEQTVEKHLQLLARRGLASEHDGLWEANQFDNQDLRRIALEAGTYGRAERQRLEHQNDRRINEFRVELQPEDRIWSQLRPESSKELQSPVPSTPLTHKNGGVSRSGGTFNSDREREASSRPPKKTPQPNARGQRRRLSSRGKGS